MASRSQQLSLGTLLTAGRGPGTPACHPLGPGGGGGLRGGCSEKFRHLSALTTQNLPCSRARRELSPPSRAWGGARGGPPVAQQQPRLRAVAGVRGPCARRAARRPTLHKGSMALPRPAGSPPAAAARPGAGTEGFAPSRPQPSPSPPAPTPLPGGPARRMELPAPSSAAVAAAALTVTLAALAAIYSRTIGFHS